jgi:AAHS family 4-hydroxybenzoate transporter-like MFS transporter
LCFGVFTLCTPLAISFTSLLAFRFLTGLGLGGAMPSFIALTSEYTPPRLRTTVVGILYAFFPLGGAIGGVLGSWLIPHWGWQWLFWIGGALPLVLALALAAFLPESIGYLVSRGGAPERIAALLRRVCGAVVAPGSLFVLGEERASGTPVAQLFGRGRALGTMLLWVSFFIAFMQLVTTTAWTPTLLSHAGVPLSQAALALAIFNIGSVIGSCSVGFLIARFGAALVLPVGFVGTAVSLSLVGYAAPSVALIWLMAGLLGLFLGCGSTGLIAVCAIFYPTAVRSTGVGWAMGMGRFGSFVGPLVIGGLVGAAWTVGPVFVAIGAPAVIAAVTAGLARSGRSAA